MPRPANDPRYVSLTALEADHIVSATARVGGVSQFCALAGVRMVETYYRATGRGQVMAVSAAAMIAAADRALGTITTISPMLAISSVGKPAA
jgi:hypothetical protein